MYEFLLLLVYDLSCNSTTGVVLINNDYELSIETVYYIHLKPIVLSGVCT